MILNISANNSVFSIDFNNIQIFTIVRNPYERVISHLFFKNKIQIDTSKKKVLDEIKKFVISTDCDNHNIPQYHFVTDKHGCLIPTIQILKTESLKTDMHKLGYTDFNNFDQCNKNKLNYYDYLNNDSIEIINIFYHLDFILFHYPKHLLHNLQF